MDTYDAVTAAGYLITDKNREAIYATGETVEAAWQDTVRDAGPFRNAEGDEIPADEAFERDFKVLPATAALIQHVADFGGCGFEWRVIRGIACTVEEAGEA
jgi:hypothetical protein